MQPLSFSVHDDELPADAAQQVDAGLGASNAAASPMHEVRALACFARDAAGAVVGGAVGRTWGGCCELQQLWVAPEWRKQGVATRLLQSFEQRAAERGCQTFYLETFSFQAPALYRAFGYEVRHELRGFAPGISKFLMVREAAPPPGAPGEVTGIDHIYISVSDLARSEAFYDLVLIQALGFRKNRFALADDPHVQYYNRHFGFVLRPARSAVPHDSYAPGLHHFCLRVDLIAEVHAVAQQLRGAGIAATEARLYPDYAPDYTATFFADPDGVRLEVTNYRQERRDRHDHWHALTEPTP